MVRARRCGHVECLVAVTRAWDRVRAEREFVPDIEPQVRLLTSIGPMMASRRILEAEAALDDVIMCRLRNHDPGDEDRSE